LTGRRSASCADAQSNLASGAKPFVAIFMTSMRIKGGQMPPYCMFSYPI
jgi:hypothetical protein